MNTLGAVVLSDGGVPRTWTAKAIETIEGGEFIVFSGAAGAVSSGANSFDTTDMTATIAYAGNANGYVVQGATSGNALTFMRRGDVLLRTAGTVVPGANVQIVSGTVPGVVPLGSATVPAAVNNAVGKVMIPAASGTSNYSAISLNL